MNEQSVMNTTNIIPVKESLVKALGSLDSKSSLILCGTICFTIIFCTGFACISGNELSFGLNGLRISQPGTVAAITDVNCN